MVRSVVAVLLIAACHQGPRLTLGQPSVRGALQPDAIRAVLQAHEDKLRACFPADADATVSIHFAIANDGRVSDAGPVDDRTKITDCVTFAIINLAFPAPGPGGAEVVYPLAFHR